MSRNSKERKAPANLYKRQLASGWTYYARVQVEKDGVMIRKAFNLETQSRVVARKKLAMLQKQDHNDPDVPVRTVETVAEAAERVVEKAKREGFSTWKDFRSILRRRALPHIGDMQVDQVTRKDIRAVLETARDGEPERSLNPLSKQSVLHLCNALSKVFSDLEHDEVIDKNPVAGVPLPTGLREDKREPVQLNPEEFEKLISYLDALPDDERILGMPVRELQTMCMAARCIGGQRTSDLHAWQWADIDLKDFAWCQVRRPDRKSVV